MSELIYDSTMSLPELVTMLRLSRNESTLQGTRVRLDDALQIAERLYRVTGGGIYRDTVLAGEQPPLREPVLNGQVLGQDTVIATPYCVGAKPITT